MALVGTKGDVITFGDKRNGGDSTSVASDLRNVIKIVGSKYSFAAVTSSGRIVCWGGSIGRQNSTKAMLTNTFASQYSTIIANDNAFAMLVDGGKVHTFGDPKFGGDLNQESQVVQDFLSSGVWQLAANSRAFAAVKSDGSTLIWGNSKAGGGFLSLNDRPSARTEFMFSNKMSFALMEHNKDVYTVGHAKYGGGHHTTKSYVKGMAATSCAFAAFYGDGTLETWGNSEYGGSTGSMQFSAVESIVSTDTAFAALTYTGRVFAWGDTASGALYAPVKNLTNVVSIQGNNAAFAAIDSDGAAYAWGDDDSGGSIPPSLSYVLSSGVQEISHTWRAFAALKRDGTVHAWGNTREGGHLPITLTGVKKICANHVAFVAIKSSGSVYTWGHPQFGGSSDEAFANQPDIVIDNCDF